MALIGFDGFDNYSTQADLSTRAGGGFKLTTIGGVGGIVTPGRGGFGRALNIGPNNKLFTSLYAPINELYVGMGLYLPADIVGTTCTVLFNDASVLGSAVPYLCGANFESVTGYVRLFGGPMSGSSLTQLAISSPGAFNGASYPMVEIHVRTGSAGAMEVRVDGLPVASVTGNMLAETGSSGLIDTIEMVPSLGGQFTIDDFRLNNTASDAGAYPNNSWMGDLRVATLFPVGDSGAQQWTPLSGANYQNVNDNPFDEGTTYNSTSATGQVDRFNFQQLPANTAAIFALQVNGMYRETDAGGRTVQQLVTIGGADHGGATWPLNTNYQELVDLFVTNPANGANWTLSDIDNIVAGYKSVS